MNPAGQTLPAPLTGRIGGLLAELAAATAALGRQVDLAVDGEFGGRPRAAGRTGAGRVSANGTCHLLRAADGWLAVNLARPDDVAAVPAMLRDAGCGEPVAALAAAAARSPAAVLAARAQLLGVPAAVLGSHRGAGVRTVHCGQSSGAAGRRVLDFSALWAGPLAAQVLHRAGYQVVTVEDPRRPDDHGSWLYGRLRAGHLLAGLSDVDSLAAAADVVVEASRPRALARLGLVAADWLSARAGRTWLSITGYGRAEDRVAFGDDAAVAGGLVGRDAGGPVFVGDAIGDPLAGLRGALAVCRSQLAGGGHLVEVAMAGVCAEFAGSAGSVGSAW